VKSSPKNLPNLKEVRAPIKPADMDGRPLGDAAQRQAWSNKRENLRKEGLFKSDRARFTTFGPRKVGEFRNEELLFS